MGFEVVFRNFDVFSFDRFYVVKQEFPHENHFFLQKLVLNVGLNKVLLYFELYYYIFLLQT